MADRPQEPATRTIRHDARTGLFVTMPRSGKMMGWGVDFTDDVEPPKSQPASARRARRGWGTLHPLRSNTHGAAAPPQPRGLARPARSFKRLEGSAAAADVLARQREQPTGGRRHTQGSGWTGAACAGACEERAGASR
jgi:hypothetical protein